MGGDALPAMTDKDAVDLRFGLGAGVDWVALSFVRTPEDAKGPRRIMDEVGIRVPLLAKIEKRRALDRIEDILHAFDGIEALSSLKKEASGRMPDFIFLDVNMPRMGGMECLENIKQIPGLKDVPVIVYSTTTNPNEIDRYLKKGAHSFITKPNSFTVLISHLKKALFAS